MLSILRKYLASFILLVSVNASAEETLELIIPNFKPYTYYQDHEFKGIGVEKIKKIFDSMNVPYSLSLAPNYGRAVDELKRGRVDGLFLASENEERNSIAEFSTPLMINRWSWFLPQGSEIHPSHPSFKLNANIATSLNTNTHKWLERNHYRVSYAPSDIRALPKMLIKKRISVVFLAERVFLESCKEQGIDPKAFIQVVEVEKPFGIYISQAYLDRHPFFMKKLNEAIKTINEQEE